MNFPRENPETNPFCNLRTTRLISFGSAAILAATLGGCGDHKLNDLDLAFATRSTTVDQGRALAVLPPGAPPIVGITQRVFDNAVSQTISLTTRGRTSGENAIYVAFLTAADVPDDVGVEGRLMQNPSIEDYAIEREMEERLPGLAMAPSATYVQNRYGPFGYAYGRSSSGDGCIYVWQRIAGGDSIFRPKSGVVSIRIRVCAQGASEMSLLRLAYGYSINGSLKRSGWNPIGDVPAPQAEIGEAGMSIYPVPQTSFLDAGDVQPRQVPRRATPRVSRSRPAQALPVEPVLDQPLEGYPIVPPPPGR